MALYKGGRRIKQIKRDGVAARLLVYKGRQVWPCRRQMPLPALGIRIADDSAGQWMEVGFSSAALLTGNATDGWTDPRGYCVLRLETSTDLVNWSVGGMVDCSDSPTDMGDGTYEYWSRAVVPEHWEDVLVDLTATSARHGKAITGITVMMTPVSLPNYPYSMPADAALLQADLRAAGFAGATVTSSSGALTAVAKNHQVGSVAPIYLTQSGTDVTGATWAGSPVSLPNYPYALPSQRADLQADLVSAGLTGAVVTLFASEWQIVLPDLAASGTVRDFSVTIDPGDPYPYWDFFGSYQGLNPDNLVIGSSGNVRTPTGDPLLEATKQFARLGISRGTRELP